MKEKQLELVEKIENLILDRLYKSIEVDYKQLNQWQLKINYHRICGSWAVGAGLGATL
jgi:hypothetical protein